MSKMTLSEELKWRGFVNQTTFNDPAMIDNTKLTFYWGVDPSAPSMTIGNLAAAMMVSHFMNHGHKAVLLVGGATGMVGDPDGKADERDLKSQDELLVNKQGISSQYKQIFGGRDFKIVDNHDWFKDMNYLQFLRDIGKHVPMRQMLARDFVSKRLSSEGSGISYAEFSYVLIQAYDFLYMNKHMGVNLQLCGSDQWGNSVAGVDLIRRINGQEAHVWSTPLVINKATGQKFGKTEDGAIWLDANLTSIFKFYQFWLNVDDAGVEDYLKIYTYLSRDEVSSLMTEFHNNPGDRIAQKTLALEVTRIVHGDDRTQSAKSVSEVLFGSGDFLKLTANDIEMLKAELPTSKSSDDLFETLVNADLASSKSEARNFVASGAVSLNGKKITDFKTTDFTKGINLLKRGKNSFSLIDHN